MTSLLHRLYTPHLLAVAVLAVSACQDDFDCDIFSDQCETDAECGAGMVCTSGTLVSFGLTCQVGTRCALDSDCAAGFKCTPSDAHDSDHPFEGNRPAAGLCTCANLSCSPATTSVSSSSSVGGGGTGVGGSAGMGGSGGRGCTTCAAELGNQPGALCDDNGPPSSLEVWTALFDCACLPGVCHDSCASTCDAADPVDSVCSECFSELCPAQFQACANDIGSGSGGGAAGSGGVAGASQGVGGMAGAGGGT